MLGLLHVIDQVAVLLHTFDDCNERHIHFVAIAIRTPRILGVQGSSCVPVVLGLTIAVHKVLVEPKIKSRAKGLTLQDLEHSRSLEAPELHNLKICIAKLSPRWRL